MWLLKYLTVFIYALGLCTVSFYIKLLAFCDWSLSVFNTGNWVVNESYDYIVVGSGSAGSIIALRLSETRNATVLLLEAGSYGGKLLDVPMEGPGIQRTTADWQYKTVPQRTACLGLEDQQSHWPMGKIVGGSMYLNNLVYARGHPADYENWFGHTFSYEEDVLKYFKKSEDQQGSYRNDSKYHGTGGPLVVDDIPFISQFGKAVLEGAKNLGFPIRDLNANSNTGFMVTQVNVRSGERYTTAHHLLKQNRRNLHVLTQAVVHRVVIHANFEARGVEFSRHGSVYSVIAREGVVLSAGVIGSPKILLLSGIGPRDHLNQVDIETKIDLQVGQNLQDHVATGLDLILLNKSIDMSMEKSIAPHSIYEYVFRGKGPLSSPGCEALGLVDFNNDAVPDLQFMVIPLGISCDGGIHFRKAMGISDESFVGYFQKLLHKTTATILPILLHPKSVGCVKLRDKNAASEPLIDPNYLQHHSDVETLFKGIELIKKLLQTKAMQKLGATLNPDIFPGCEGHRFDTKEYWECYIRHLTLTSYHPVGTCKMGPASDHDRVVETNFRVRGTNKLFIADGSVIPSLPSGNINAVVVMMAEKAAEAIRKEEYLSRGQCFLSQLFFK